MGGGFSSKYDESFEVKDWEKVGQSQDKGQQYTIVKNKITGQLLDRYQVQCSNQKQYQKYMISVNFRRNEDNIVRIIHYQPKIIKQFCGSSYILNVYLQHCKSRLNEFEDIPSPDYLYCALAMLNGFQKLFRKIGRFYVSGQTVMIDQLGKIRVWINSNFAENQAEDVKYLENQVMEKNQEYCMVDDIVGIVLQNLDEEDQQYQIKFKDYYNKKKVILNQKVGFIEAKNIINEFAKINRIQIPNAFNAVLNLYQQQKIQEIKNQQMTKNVFNNTNINNNISFNQNNGDKMTKSQINTNSIIPDPFIRGTSMPINSRPGINNTIAQITNYPSNPRTPIPPVQQYQIPAYSSIRVATPLSPIQTPSSPTHKIIHYSQISPIQPQNIIHNYPIISQTIPMSSRFVQQSNNSQLPIHHSLIKQQPFTYQIQPVSSVSQPKIIINSSNIITPINQLQTQKRIQKQLIKFNIKEQKKIQLCQEQLQIQKNYILKDNMLNNSNNYYHDQNIIQAHIIKQLSQLHKIQQFQKYNNPNNDQIPQKNNSKIKYDYNEKQNKQKFNQQQNLDNLFHDTQLIHYKQNISSVGSSVQGDDQYLQLQNKNIVNNNIPLINPPRIQPSFTPILSKQSQPYYQNGYTPQIPKQAPSQQKMFDHFSNFIQNSPYNVNLANSNFNRQFYYTLHDQVELDPEIVNDLSLYVQS